MIMQLGPESVALQVVSIYPEELAFVPPFLEGHGAFQVVCDQDLAPQATTVARSASELRL
jgi:hypothetical protein